MSQFMEAIKEKVLTLPGETIVWPGHDYGARPSSTIQIERETNPWLS
jgi:glyoxylase-like metal-dependent hydrolase (beta-lactamase superfamily II)